MDLRSMIERANQREWERCQEEERQLRAEQEPFLAESSRLSNLMAGERGKVSRTEENISAYEEASRKIAEIGQRILESQHKANAFDQEPLDPKPLLEEARAQLEQAKRLRKWAGYHVRYRGRL